MTHDAFNTLLEARIENMRSTLQRKATEYATEDRLHNFKRAAGLTGRTPAQACVGMMAKHLVSVVDIVDRAAAGEHIYDAVLEEKIGDAMNYMPLLHALMLECTARGPELFAVKKCTQCSSTAEPDCGAGRCAQHCDERCDTHCERSMRSVNQQF